MKSSVGKIVVLLLLAMALANIVYAGTFKNKTWNGSDFPYIGALFCHDGDYVRFACTAEHHRFYYMTMDDANAYIEFYIDGKGQGTVNVLPKNKWNREHFSYANWQHFDLGQGFIGHTVEIHLVENRTVNRQYCPPADIIIKLQDNSQAILWRNVDSTSQCDLDQVAR